MSDPVSDRPDGQNIFSSEERGTGTPEWKRFDADWYRRRYRSVFSDREKEADQQGGNQALEALWVETGGLAGRSPNRFFSEQWYLSYNKEVGRHIHEGGIFETGFQHYKDMGVRSCSPHWLFREEDYFRRNPDLSYRDLLERGFVNGYDHYLSFGDRQGRQVSRFFRPDLFISQALREGLEIEPSQGIVRAYLSLENPKTGRVRTSWYFDPQWYLKRYPEVASLIESGRYGLPLEHYLCNDAPTRFDPNPYFSEVHYLTQYSDIEKAVEEGLYRNGYEHFLGSGLFEGRQPHPSVTLDLGVMKGGRAHLLIDYNVEDAFALYTRQKEENFASDPLFSSVEGARSLAITRLEAHLPALYREPLVFDTSCKPRLSVVIASEGDYLSVTASLLSLYQQGFSGQDILIASNGTLSERERLEKTFKNLRFAPSFEWRSDKALFRDGVKQARCDQILLLYAGVNLHQGAMPLIKAAFARKDVAGGGGQVLSANQTLLEAGIQVFRDGSLVFYGRGGKAFSQDISFGRIADGFQRGAFFGYRSDLLPLLETLAKETGLSEERSGFLTVTLSLSAMGKTLVYEPDLLLTDLETGSVFETPSYVPALFKQNFASYLAEKSLPFDQHIPPFGCGKARTILLIYERFPLEAEGGFSRRALDLIRLLDDEGWDIALLALKEGAEDRLVPLQSFPSSVRCFIGEEYLEDFFVRGRGAFDLVWMNGVPVASHFLSLVRSVLRSAQDFVLDITTLAGNGLQSSETYLRRRVGGQDDPARFLSEVQQELAGCWVCRAVVTDNEWEAGHIRKAIQANVIVIPNRFRSLGFTPQMEERTGLLFPVPIHHAGDAAHDGFDWFCLQVAPVLKEILPGDFPLWVGAWHHPDVDLAFYERFTSVKGLTSPMSVEEKMAQCRLAIVPTRVMNTLSPEILDVIGAGLPGVMSSSVLEELGFEAGKEAMDGGFNDPHAFALAIAELYTDEALWRAMSKAASDKITDSYDLAHFRKAVKALLAQIEAPVFSPQPMKIISLPQKRRFQPAPLMNDPDSEDDIEETNISRKEEEDVDDREMTPGIRLGVTLET